MISREETNALNGERLYGVAAVCALSLNPYSLVDY
jgi:hypothetical protein